MNIIPLLKQIPAGSGVILLHLSETKAADAAYSWIESGLTVRMTRGRKMRTLDALFDEVSAALQFPYYFGENWAAFNECLSEMEWLPQGTGFVLLIMNADEVLADDPDEFAPFMRTVATALKSYSDPINDGEWWDRPPIPFHIILQADAAFREQIINSWNAAGTEIYQYPLE